MMGDEKHICVKCKHLDKGGNSTYSVHWRCTPAPENINYVTGRQIPLNCHALNQGGDCTLFERTLGPITATEVAAAARKRLEKRPAHSGQLLVCVHCGSLIDWWTACGPSSLGPLCVGCYVKV